MPELLSKGDQVGNALLFPLMAVGRADREDGSRVEEPNDYEDENVHFVDLFSVLYRTD